MTGSNDFTYTGVDRQGNKVSGKISATNEGEVRMILRNQGIRPVKLSSGVFALDQDIFAMFKPRAGTGSVSLSVLSAFTRQLQVLIGSGIPLVTALEILGEENDDIHLRQITSEIREKISGGAYLWESIAGYPKAFPRIYSALVRAGESSGALETVLDRLAGYLETIDKLTKQIKSAMFYPMMVVVVGVGVIAGMMILVIPRFQEMFREGKQELPWLTQKLISVSNLMTNNILYILGVSTVLVYFVNRYVRSEEGRGVFDRLVFKSPIFGKLMQKAAMARFTRTLSTLLGSGVPLIDGIDICKNTVDNTVVEEQVGRIRKEIEDGKSLSSTLSRLPAFPKLTVQMVRVGEATGSLEKMLDRTGKMYEQDVEAMVAGLSKLVEPVILVVLGSIVGVILIAMYIPMFQMGQTVS